MDVEEINHYLVRLFSQMWSLQGLQSREGCFPQAKEKRLLLPALKIHCNVVQDAYFIHQNVPSPGLKAPHFANWVTTLA